MNYNASEVGVPYCRANRITINYPDNNTAPSLTIEQSMAVKLKDGTVRRLEELQPISSVIDFTKVQDPIQLVDLETGLPQSANTNLGEVFTAVLAFVRNEQVKSQQ